MRQAKTIWHFKTPGDKSGGFEIITPHNRIWGRVHCMTMAAKICSGFNFARDLQAACETGEMCKINEVLLAYKQPSEPEQQR